MSLSKPHSSNSPVKRWFKLKGTNGGGITYWDKSAEAERAVSTPFHFVVLDSLNSITGFHKPSNTGIRSNEIRDTRTEPLVVRAGATVLAEGLYNDIKDVMKGKGGKFANSLYVAFKDGDELVIGNLLLSGAALSEFFDFKKGKSLDKEPGVAITGFDGPHMAGTNEYWVPVFGSWTPQDLSAAIALDETLQAYLDGTGQAEEPTASEPSFGGGGASSDWDDSEPPF
ncbi:hypothetical protein OPTIMUS_127 [Mycobacterium phage Optimus]|uniref:Uncharacterized protein n=1 Tax=Mycobacterium phage Optimus TaxID=2922218 RepID=G1DAR6_9CAUD|nr:hypothetical protein FDG54_gp127 [Mycobacterium phage Optimus]AWH13949.1 hypothetical protein SEA_HALLEY_138 [Mycobacterium phage Halley]AXF51620.1 hypothetical protein CONSTELLA_130 [Mycobacterium phage Constella]AXQ52129.1 hypothetical protein SEA_EJIMIX_129 [Mycobacterium phage Ejimix]AXQ52360.1 hypothetical protein SEA_ERICMILLARD_128 [Mycobacterium phage EricMillard]QDM57953.1 hypothetical protein SEA_NIHILNOMEN_138 [Mycobacterium phage NihilNomen]QDP43882.1 hypothetical protein SEA_D